MSKHRIEIVLGALAPKLTAQLDGYRVRKSPTNYPRTMQIQHWQAYADAIVLLSVNGIMSEGERNKARQRLVREIAANVVGLS